MGFNFALKEILFFQKNPVLAREIQQGWSKRMDKRRQTQPLHFGEIVTPGGRWDRPERSIGSFLTLARPSRPLSKVATINRPRTAPNEYVLQRG